MGARERERERTHSDAPLSCPGMLLGMLSLSPPLRNRWKALMYVAAAAPATAVVAMAAGTATCLGETVGDECEEVSKTKAEAP